MATERTRLVGITEPPRKYYLEISALVILGVCIVALCLIKSRTNVEYKIVETSDGKVRGFRDTTLLKKVDFFAFKGIPYAKVPTGELRFKAPKPIESWAPTTLDATAFGSICIQTTTFSPNSSLAQSENCLFVNVYVPADVKSDEKLAVLFYIHGGAFVEGSGNDDMCGPDFLIEKRVILVTFNYRLGLFGFLSFNTPEYSGNMALKDQQLALKWTHANIERFGGDNKRITVFGESSGSMLTHIQVLSSESRKYFRRAILLSGTAENPWGFSNNDHLTFAHKIAQDLGKPQDSVQGLIAFFTSVSPEAIVQYADPSPIFNRIPVITWAPIIERQDAIRPFMVEYPDEIYNKSEINIDTMFSFCFLEFVSFYRKQLKNYYDLEGLDRNFTLVFPFRAYLPFDSTEYKKLAAEVRYYYFKDAAIDKKTLKRYVDLMSDILYAYGIDKTAKQHAAKSVGRTFYYRFSVDSTLNAIKRWAHGGAGFWGAGHADDLCYIFRCRNAQQFYDEVLNTPENEQSKISLQAVENMSKLVTNFAKYGEPVQDDDAVGKLMPINSNQMHFLDVTNNGFVLGESPNQAAVQFWAHIEEEVHKINTKTNPSIRETL